MGGTDSSYDYVIPGRAIARTRNLEIPGLVLADHPGMTKADLHIQRLILPEDAVLVEGDAAVAGEIGLDIGSRGDAVVQIDQAGNPALEGFHALGKCIAQAFDDLEQREINISDPAAGEIGAAIAVQQLLEIAEIFWRPLLPEFVGALFRRLTLILVIQRGAERM